MEWYDKEVWDSGRDIYWSLSGRMSAQDADGIYLMRFKAALPVILIAFLVRGIQMTTAAEVYF